MPLGNEEMGDTPPDVAGLNEVTPVGTDTVFGTDFPAVVASPGNADEGIVDDSVTSGGDPSTYGDDDDSEDDDNEG